jgi:murein peptide amidase A
VTSVEGRAIEVIRLGPDGPVALLLFGAIHGDEPGSAELCTRYLQFLDGKSLERAVVIVPVVNPDGLALNRKNNAHDVDLNRNFAARSWIAEHPHGYHPGSAPLCEPESRLIAELVESLAPRVIVAAHQPFACVNWDGPAEALALRMSEACGFPAVASVGYPTPGSFGACYGIDRNLPVITFELPRPVADGRWDGCLRALECARTWTP